ncbi:Glycogenin-2 [Candida viswanathii]|uniref:Glycogenin-2 n=1 Tax=Candida viswanathii TaxID=5486 RepID=A0A367Y7M4_9ASCO|nr:Glycogenin-2 [Candida viswanathii]
MTNAVFTLLYNPDYLAGALVLGTTLKKLLSKQETTPQYPDTKLGVLIDKSNFTPYQLQLLATYYDDLIDVSPLKSTIVGKLTYDLKRPELDKTFTKVKLWSLLPYEKILYLDSDTLPIIPIAENGGSILDLLALDFPKFKILAAPDSGFPDIFNSGVFVLKPNLDDYSNLSALVRESATNPDVSFDGADQGLLNQYFNAQPDWVQNLLKKDVTDVSDINYTQDSHWIKIPFLYNVTPSAEYQYLPAFKHFQQPPQPSKFGQPPVEAELEDHGGEQPTQDEEIWKTTVETLGHYHSTALLYINYRTTQVKLVHFIGPFKPWRLSSTIAGIHKDWWKIWIEEFGEKSVPDVIYREQHPIQEPVHHHHDAIQTVGKPGEESTYEIKTIEEYSEAVPPPIDVSDPVTLLDPANYQRFEDNVQPTVDSMWDPTREPPPQHVEYHAPQGYETFDQSLKSFTNEWDHHHHEDYHEPPPPPPPAPEPYYAPPPPPPAYHEEHHHHHHEEHHPPQEQHYEEPQYHHHEEPHHEEHHHEEQPHHEEYHHHEEPHHEECHYDPPHHEEEQQHHHHHYEEHHVERVFPEFIPQERPELYGHRYVKPERVFDNSNDYYPTHLLQELEKIDINKDAASNSGSQSPNPSDLAAEVTSFNEVNEELSKEGYIEETAFEEVYDEDKEGIEVDNVDQDLVVEEEEDEEIPKLFPWEFRSDGKVTAERVFDY